MHKKFQYSLGLLSILLIIGCGGGGSDDTGGENINTQNSNTLYKLSPQEGKQSYLFYGNTNHKSLGSLRNVRVFDPSNPQKTIISNDDTGDIQYPVLTTTMQYNNKTKSYSDLHLDSLYYVANKKAYRVPLLKDNKEPSALLQTNSDVIIDPKNRSHGYKKFNYIGTKQYLIAENQNGQTILLTPDMKPSDSPIIFENRSLLSLTYPSYGADVDGYIVYDSNVSGTGVKEIQKCSLDMQCNSIKTITGKYKFIGDISYTTLSAIEIDGKFYKLDKSDGSIQQLNITPVADKSSLYKKPRGAASKYYFNDDSIYFIDANHNISRYNIITSENRQISHNGKTDRIRAFTNDMVIYGPTDSEMYAVKKDGTSSQAITLSIATKTSGQKYPYTMAIGDQYLYNMFNLNPNTGKMTFRACKLENSKIECRNDSFWASITAAKSGQLNLKSTYQLTPYAYIRVDNTDNFGGGTLKAIDPNHPMDDGIKLGSVANFNFQTFMDNSRYVHQMIDSNGGVVIYAKNDLDYRGDAFFVNLNKENSLINLTKEKSPDISQINADRGHCHGRYCSVCHSFAGGKIFIDKKGSDSAKGYNIKFNLENGETLKASIRKGEGENFNIPLQKLVNNNFTAMVFNEQNGTVVNRSNEFSHRGAEYFNCNFCHRKGDLRHDAPNVITIEK